MPKKEAWNDVDHVYKKTLIKYKHKNEGLERKKRIVVIGT
jgi:hypothetical protein